MLKPVFVWQEKVLHRVNPREIICLVTEENYIKVHFPGDIYIMIRCTLSNALKKLPADMFIRTDRACAVSIFYIDKVYREYLVIGEQTIPIAKQFYKSVLEKLDILK